MRIRMIEACEPESNGSMGCQYIMNSIRESGFNVVYIDDDKNDNGEYDLELISVHHCSDFPRVLGIKKRAPIRIIGGHPMQNNPRPIISHADVVCIGEGESWIKEVLAALDAEFSVDALVNIPGTIISKYWTIGAKIPATRMEKTVPNHPAYLNIASKGHAKNWYLEIGRGCPFSCNYCELGHSVKARMRNFDDIIAAVDAIDMSLSKKITFFAPDEASHKHYGEILEYIHQKGFITQFGSMRLDQILRKKNIPFKSNMLIRVGIDGLSESIRFKVNKNLSNKTIVDYFHYMFENGHVNFKVFQVFSYPFETMQDWEEWENLYQEISSFDFKKHVMLRIKFTPFIPQPITPLGNETPQYNFKIAHRIKEWAKLNKKPRYGEYGINLTLDGVMNFKSHSEQCLLTNGNETIDLSKYVH